MIPKNNFKSLHRKYYCLKFMIFKLQVKRVLCCCCFKTHSEDCQEARPLFLLQGQRSCLRELSFYSFRMYNQLSVHTDSSYQGHGSPVPVGGV